MFAFPLSTSLDLSPIRLSYGAALRGVKPRAPMAPFTYAHMNCRDPLRALCLAASNPEGHFYAVMEDETEAARARSLASARQVGNITFLTGALPEINAVENSMRLPALDYLVCEAGDASLTEADQEALFDFAQKKLRPSGLFAYRYGLLSEADELLRFLVNEFKPEMTPVQVKEFLDEIKALGTLYFADRPDALKALDAAIRDGKPELFFTFVDAGNATPARSSSFDVMTGLLRRGFAFAGDADVRANYMELVTPLPSHEILEKCREHILYEPIKDFAAQRLERCDIWCRTPVDQTGDIVALFGGFTYGITASVDSLPAEIALPGKTINLRLSPFDKLIDLMSTLPTGIGDFLAHPSGQGVNATDALASLQTLVAAGIARPMRGAYEVPEEGVSSLNAPKWAVTYNSYLNESPVETSRILLASAIIGSPVTVPARDALVMQALARAGLANSASALLPELDRVSADPALASQIMDVAEPTAEVAHSMIQSAMQNAVVRWYAFGLLAA